MDKAPRRASAWAAYTGRSSHHTGEICCFSSGRLGHFLPPENMHEHKFVPKYPVLLCTEHTKKPWHHCKTAICCNAMAVVTATRTGLDFCSQVICMNERVQAPLCPKAAWYRDFQGGPSWLHHLQQLFSCPDFVYSSLGKNSGVYISVPSRCWARRVAAGCGYWGGANSGFIKSLLTTDGQFVLIQFPAFRT